MQDTADLLEVRIRSAEDLQDARLLKIGKVLHSSARAWITSSDHPLQARPPLHSHLLDAADYADDTLYPVWPTHHSSLRLSIPAATSSKLYLVIRLFGQRRLRRASQSSKVVGTVTIPLTDIISSGSQSWQLLSYHVKRPSGRLQGVLNLSARFLNRSACNDPLLPRDTMMWLPSAPPLPPLTFSSQPSTQPPHL